MGCRSVCAFDEENHKCCLECEESEHMEECPDYVKEDGDESN
jgi:hypothetical protein|nr:MAG TPA: hypothetical protein [Caudoviricetes sp.]